MVKLKLEAKQMSKRQAQAERTKKPKNAGNGDEDEFVVGPRLVY